MSTKTELVETLAAAGKGAPSLLMKHRVAELQEMVDALPAVTRKDTGKWVRFYDATGYEIGRLRNAELDQIAALIR